MDYSKIDSRLQCAMDDQQAPGRGAMGVRAPEFGIVTSHDAGPRLPVFLICKKGEEPRSYANANVTINGRSGDCCTAFASLSSIGELSDDPAIEAIVPSWETRPLMNVAGERVKVPQFRAATQLSGRGVIIGVIDTGIDVRHPAFAGRILRLWDQTLPGPGVKEARFGAEFFGSSMETSRDTKGHGTHVAGIAAGADSAFLGVAPGADLIIVKSTFQTAHIGEGIRYIFRIAKEMNRAAVINLSLGSHSDPHDGTDPFSMLINAESGPGRIVCCAAGNEGNDAIHAQVTLSGNSTKSIRFKVDAPEDPEITTAFLNGWYNGSQEAEVGIRLPNNQFTGFQKIIDTGNSTKTLRAGKVVIQISTPARSPLNGDRNFVVTISPLAALPAGTWQLMIRGRGAAKGPVDVWATRATFHSNVQDNQTIGSPATAAGAITVASFTSRNRWQVANGETFGAPFEVDDISDFSSEGPLRNGGQKPDIAAPGAMIISALSRHFEADDATRILDHPDCVIMNGTSMAAPFIAGLVALMLEGEPTLTKDQALDRLKAAASIPGKPQSTFDTRWGFGLVDASKIVVAKTAKA